MGPQRDPENKPMAEEPKSLTDSRVAALKPADGKRLVVRDAGRGSERGLELRVSETGVKTWSIRYYRPSDGKRIRLHLGTYPAMGLDKAREESRATRYALDKRDDPSIAREQRKGADTFVALATEYLSTYARNLRSRGEIRRILEREWYPTIGAMKAVEVPRLTISKHLEKIAVEAPVGANRALAAVRGVYRWALATGRLTTIPVIGMRRPSEEKSRKRALTDEEIAKLWAGLPTSKMDDDMKDAIRLCLILGQRVGEVTGMRKAEIDLHKRLWVLPSQRAKNDEAHSIPLTEMALEIIEPRLEGRGHLVFPGHKDPKVPILPSAPNRAIRRNLDHFGIEQFTAHDLRRTVNTGMSRLKIDVQTRARVLNHVSTRRASITENVYNVHEFDEEKRHALAAWEAKLRRIIDAQSAFNIIEMCRA